MQEFGTIRNIGELPQSTNNNNQVCEWNGPSTENNEEFTGD